MSVTVYEGSDFAGKTTEALNMLLSCYVGQEQRNGIYIHFPIRKSTDVVRVSVAPPSINKFKHCDPFTNADGNLLDLNIIQEIILINIASNVDTILSYYDSGYDVFIDRFILSNFVYRALHNVPITSTCYNLCCTPSMERLMGIANHVIMVPPDEVLATRHNANRGKDESEFDKLNEQIENIYRTNAIYREYEASRELRIAYGGYELIMPLKKLNE
jgi:hypothetical protein